MDHQRSGTPGESSIDRHVSTAMDIVISGLSVFVAMSWALLASLAAVFLWPPVNRLGIGVYLVQGFLVLGLLSVGITFFRRAIWKGPGTYEIFSGAPGWIMAIIGLALSTTLLLVLPSLAFRALLIGFHWAFGVGVALGLIAWWMWHRCWMGQRRLRGLDGGADRSALILPGLFALGYLATIFLWPPVRKEKSWLISFKAS